MTTPQVKIGPRIVRAWFDSIINPLIDALESEMRMLRSRNFTWRFRPAGFESIRRISHHLDVAGSANLEQLVALYPNLDAVFRDHDRQVEALRKEVQKLEEAIVSSPGFRQHFDAITSPESLRAIGASSPTELFGAYPEEDWIKMLAQYVINNSGELQSHYATARLWNPHRVELLRTLQSPDIEVRYQAVLNLADTLLEVDSALEDQLKDLRLELSLEHDQPFAGIESGVRDIEVEVRPLSQ